MISVSHHRQLSSCLADHPLLRGEDDVEETSLRVGEVFRPHTLEVVGRRQRLRAEMNHTSFGHVSFSRLRYRADVAIDSDPLETFFLLMFPLSGAADIRCGHERVESDTDRASVIGPREALSMNWDAECHQLIVRIDRTALESACSRHLGHELPRPLAFELGMALEAPHTAPLQSLVSFLASTDRFASTAVHSPLIMAQTEELLLTALLSGQPHNYHEELLRPAQRAAPYFVRRCEDYMQAHAEAPLTMQGLAEHAGVSIRSLQMGFQNFRNTTPMAFLRDVRLQRVHDDLVTAKVQMRRVTVTEVALHWGFGHMGHFTKAYAAKFSELPSNTLRV